MDSLELGLVSNLRLLTNRAATLLELYASIGIEHYE